MSKEVKIVQEKANRRMVYIVIIASVLFILFVAWVVKTQFIPVLEHGCSAYGEGYIETIREYTSASGDTYIEYKCCKNDNSTCITTSGPKRE